MAQRGSKPGERRGGRKKGTPNNSEIARVKDTLKSLGVRPGEYSARIVIGDVPCGVCHGIGATKFQPARGQQKLSKRTCESCYGSGKERLSPELRQKADAELLKYCEPQLKAIEVTGSGGGPVLTDITVHFVRADNGKPAD